ncbi:DNA replication initiation control protein YabA [Lacticaseibacillus camelliae]|uniref:Regulator of replication initiation timing n=1 Tax=Lacticaseibacillus camelliae DSM 22697 = JCM 13995 TaxID=1423730 RepID=A0A0R2F369_9LACO|nr:DNA replication initiation control protein YabA [Lacticaseibacillus camelliae]KRN23008.1 Regulator of replication initiation timing [Lacticaseibacillus camelliae DSM 22697 = JCM 13995]
MEKKDLYDNFIQLEHDAQGLLTRVTGLKNDVAKALERNAELEMENKHLREHLAALDAAHAQSTGATELTKSKANLESLYNEGFHVCPYMYGQRRVDDEPCAFCLDVIYGEH